MLNYFNGVFGVNLWHTRLKFLLVRFWRTYIITSSTHAQRWIDIWYFDGPFPTDCPITFGRAIMEGARLKFVKLCVL